MSGIADRITYAQDKDGMLRRALERIIQLYTDRSHFVYELLQNAEDAEAHSVRFVQYKDRLEMYHDGKPFTEENLKGLCDIGKSDKVDNLNQIGEFGVGFKSVFGICDTVRLYNIPENYRDPGSVDAVPFAVEIVDFTRPVEIQMESIGRSYTTKFVFPYTVGRNFSGFKSLSDLNATLSKKLQNLGITTLLFMKNLELIEYSIMTGEKEIAGEYLLEKTNINDHCMLVSALGVAESAKSQDEEISYLKFSRTIDNLSNRTVDIAFPIKVTEKNTYECLKPHNPYISVYFPTETESKLGFIVQGPFRTTPNRSSIPADDPDNINLAKITATLLQDSLLELRDSGKLNMSFLKAMPISARSFDHYELFAPLYDMVKALFTREPIIPTRDGSYVTARQAKIARQERLATLFSGSKLAELLSDGGKHQWLPTYLTETNREYEAVYKYLSGDLKITIIRPEDLRTYFASNPYFLPKQSNDWIVELYSILENVGAAFTKTKGEANMLTADIIKTSTGSFVAAYRRTENKQYIPNVFLPSTKVKSSSINFVDRELYERCRHFFDDILELQEPNEYEFFIKDIKERYSEYYQFDEIQHIEDIQKICKYLRNDDYCTEIKDIINSVFVLKCTDGRMWNTYTARVYLPTTDTGINIELYFKNITSNVHFADISFYEASGITQEMLCKLGVVDSLIIGEHQTQGTYLTGYSGRQPEWWTVGDFRWKLNLENIKDVIKYISNHPNAKDAVIKSKVIFSILLQNAKKLCGTVRIGGSTPDLVDEPCELIQILRGDKTRDWNGKWLYTESLEVVSPKAVTKHEISTSIYGKIIADSPVYDMLGFKRTESDDVAELKKTIPQKQLDAYFESELLNRFGISSDMLAEKFGSKEIVAELPDHEVTPEFPTARVKNWETIKKHAAEILCFAAPVDYQLKLRRIRISNRNKEARAYLFNMYRYDGTHRYACQMCHEPTANIEAIQMFNEASYELDPLHLCLCPNCASKYRLLRNSQRLMATLKKTILDIRENDVSTQDYFAQMVDDSELWFTQVHIAEIQALLQLTEDVSEPETISSPQSTAEEPVDAEEGTSGMSVFSAYVGKKLKRKDGFLGEVISVDDQYLTVKVLNGDKAGTETKIVLSFVLKENSVYEII